MIPTIEHNPGIKKTSRPLGFSTASNSASSSKGTHARDFADMLMTAKSFPNSAQSLPLVFSLESALAACCFSFGWWTISNSNSKIQSHQFSCNLSHGKDPLAHFMISSDLKAGSFQIGAPKQNSPCKSQALSVYSGTFLLFVIRSTRPVEDRAPTSVYLLLKKYTIKVLIASVSIESVLAFFSVEPVLGVL